MPTLTLNGSEEPPPRGYSLGEPAHGGDLAEGGPFAPSTTEVWQPDSGLPIQDTGGLVVQEPLLGVGPTHGGGATTPWGHNTVHGGQALRN